MKAELTPAILAAMNRRTTLRPPPLPVDGMPSPAVVAALDKPGGHRGLQEIRTAAPIAKDWKFTIPGVPMGKPRMTRRDQWKKRKVVVRFRAWADVARASAPKDLTTDPLTVSWTAYLPLPASWSQKKREAHVGTIHRQKPDRDNIDKGILDALWKRDERVGAGTIVKRWDDGKGPRIEIHVTAL